MRSTHKFAARAATAALLSGTALLSACGGDPPGHDDIGAHDDNNDGTSAGVSAGARCDDHDVDTYGANDSVIFCAKEEKVLLF